MQWLQLLDWTEIPEQSKYLKAVRKWKKFTLYDHNCQISINQEDQTFTCVFNSKKLNTQHSIIGKIKGNLRTNVILLSNSLTDNEGILTGKWQYQKIQLTRFAFRYNERSKNNILIKVNPINGQIRVCMNFFMNPSLFEEEHKYKQIMTDYCQKLGEQSEKIFNTVLQIIFQRQSNEPYLKSGVKVNPNFPRYMKIEKLLDKVKSLMATSSFYQIRTDTTSAHQNRSRFKKIYLANDKQYITDRKISRMALLYELKYNKIYERPSKDHSTQKPRQHIKDYVELEEKNETQFAKHRNENAVYEGQAGLIIDIESKGQADRIRSFLDTFDSKLPTKMAIKTKYGAEVGVKYVLVDLLTPKQSKLTSEILKRIGNKHPNIVQFYCDPRYPDLRMTQGYNSWPLEEFLTINRHTMGMSTKFDLMAQLCHVSQFLHKKGIGCFFRLEDIIVDEFYRLRLRSLNHAYAIDWKKGWREANQVQNFTTNNDHEKPNMIVDYIGEVCQFPYINIVPSNIEIGSNQKQTVKRFIDNEKCDVSSLGLVLYRIMIDKYPFCVSAMQKQLSNFEREDYDSIWEEIWTVQTQYFLTQGGPIAKIVANLLIKCFNEKKVHCRPYVEWLTVILSEIKTSLNGLY